MHQHFDPLFQSIDLSRKLQAKVLSNCEELIALDFDHGQEFVESRMTHLKKVCSDRGVSGDFSELSEAMKFGMQLVIDFTRDAMLAVTDHQIARLRLLNAQANEIQKEISAVFNQLALIKPTATGDNRTNRSTALSQKLAA